MHPSSSINLIYYIKRDAIGRSWLKSKSKSKWGEKESHINHNKKIEVNNIIKVANHLIKLVANKFTVTEK